MPSSSCYSAVSMVPVGTTSCPQETEAWWLLHLVPSSNYGLWLMQWMWPSQALPSFLSLAVYFVHSWGEPGTRLCVVCNEVTSCPLKVSLLLWRLIGLPNLLCVNLHLWITSLLTLSCHSSLSGAVELEKLPLKKDALKKLKLPVDIKSGTAQLIVWLQAVASEMKPASNLLCFQTSW